MGAMILKILRAIFSRLDWIASFLVMTTYEMFVQISDAGIFKQSDIRQFSTRIYAFLGLIMVFKVSISLVSYIMNPDNFSKGDVGAPAIIKGFVFALVGIVVVPYIFEIAFSAQRIILKNNIIGNLIMGISNGTNNDKDYMWKAGRSMASTTLRAFIKPNTAIDVIDESCAEVPANCEEFLKLFDNKRDEIKAIFDEDPVSPYKLVDLDLINATVKADGKEVFVMDYTFIISTLCLVFIAYILLLFCFDIAVRSVKLSFLQLIAPIPLIAKIDPKKGGKIFDNWVKECTTTYLDLFFRIAAIFFALFLISSLSGVYHISDGSSYNYGAWIYVEVFLIIGILNFARELPKLLGTILGIDFKGLGGFSLNPLKNKNFAPIGAGVALGSSIASGIRRARDMKRKDEYGNIISDPNDRKLKKMKRNEVILSALSGFSRSAENFAKGKNWYDINAAQVARNNQLEKLLIDSDGDKYVQATKDQILSNVFGTISPEIVEAKKSVALEAEKKKLKEEREEQELKDKKFKEVNDRDMNTAKSLNDCYNSVEADVKKTDDYKKRESAVSIAKQTLNTTIDMKSKATGGRTSEMLEQELKQAQQEFSSSTDSFDLNNAQAKINELEDLIEISKSYDKEIERQSKAVGNLETEMTNYLEKANYQLFSAKLSGKEGGLSAAQKSQWALFLEDYKQTSPNGEPIEFIDVDDGSKKILNINDITSEDETVRQNAFFNLKAYISYLKLEKSKHEHESTKELRRISDAEYALKKQETSESEDKKRADEVKKAVDNSVFGKGSS